MDNEQASLPFGSSEETAETPLSSFPKSFMSGTVVPPEKRNKYTRMKDDLFKILAGKPTDFFSRHPVFKQFFFEEIVRLAADASPEVATQLRKNVETSFQLKGINYSLPAKLAVCSRFLSDERPMGKNTSTKGSCLRSSPVTKSNVKDTGSPTPGVIELAIDSPAAFAML